MKKYALLLLGLVALTSCKHAVDNKTDNIIGKQKIEITDGKLTPEMLWSMGSMGAYTVSPNGKQIAHTITYFSLEQDKGNSDIYLMPSEGGESKQITRTAEGEYNLTWLDDNKLAFIRGTNIVAIDINTLQETLIASLNKPIEGFMVAPDKKSLVYIATVDVIKPEHIDKLYDGLDKTTGRINEDLMYRHWDQWVDNYPHIFYMPLVNGIGDTTKTVDLLANEPYECPIRPWNGIEQCCYSPDSKQIAYSCKKQVGYEYAHSTNTDIYLYNIADHSVTNLSEGIMGYDNSPVFSHDGKYIAWESMERDGYESDKNRLMILELATGTRIDLTENFDYSVAGLTWSDDDSQIVAGVQHQGTRELFAFNIATRNIRQLSQDNHYITGYQLHGKDIYASETWSDKPTDLYHYSLTDSMATGKQLTAINNDVVSQLRFGKCEKHWVKTVDNKEMLTWVVYPNDYDSTKSYPALVFCLGGPQGLCAPTWGNRWNMALYSAAGYFVIMPNRRGCTSFGSEWVEEVSGDYGGLAMQDLMAAADQCAKDIKGIDPERLGAFGASFGGYSVYWLEGHNDNHRFKAFFAHDGIFNLEQEYLETDELFFANWDFGGNYWDKSNKKAQASYAQSPHHFIDKWNTPLCVVHSEFDFRIAASQGMAAYNAAKLKGLDARYLYFPDETHWVNRPQNTVLWNRTLIDWFDRYLK